MATTAFIHSQWANEKAVADLDTALCVLWTHKAALVMGERAKEPGVLAAVLERGSWLVCAKPFCSIWPSDPDSNFLSYNSLNYRNKKAALSQHPPPYTIGGGEVIFSPNTLEMKHVWKDIVENTGLHCISARIKKVPHVILWDFRWEGALTTDGPLKDLGICIGLFL